jgi:hypothetical protein
VPTFVLASLHGLCGFTWYSRSPQSAFVHLSYSAHNASQHVPEPLLFFKPHLTLQSTSGRYLTHYIHSPSYRPHSTHARETSFHPPRNLLIAHAMDPIYIPTSPPSLAQTIHYPLTPDAPLLMSPVSSRQQNHFHQQILLPTMSISSSTERSPVAKSQSPASYIHLLHRTAPPNPTQLYAATSLRYHLHLLDSRYRLFPKRSTPHLFKSTALTTTIEHSSRSRLSLHLRT